MVLVNCIVKKRERNSTKVPLNKNEIPNNYQTQTTISDFHKKGQ